MLDAVQTQNKTYFPQKIYNLSTRKETADQGRKTEEKAVQATNLDNSDQLDTACLNALAVELLSGFWLKKEKFEALIMMLIFIMYKFSNLPDSFRSGVNNQLKC